MTSFLSALAGIDFERMIHFNADFDFYFHRALANFRMLKCTDARKGIIFVRNGKNPNHLINFLLDKASLLLPWNKKKRISNFAIAKMRVCGS